MCSHRRTAAPMLLGIAAMLAATVRRAPAAVVQVVVVAGQSNAVGYGSDAAGLPPALSVPQTDIRFRFEEGSFFSLSNPALRIDSHDVFGALHFQSDPSGLTFFGPVDGFGPEMALGRAVADFRPLP